MLNVLIWIVALVLGAFVPALLLGLVTDFWLFKPAFLITLSHSFAFGLPGFLIYRYVGMSRARWAMLGGFLIGAVPPSFYAWPYQSLLEFAWLVGGLGCLGALGAFSCWLVLRRGGQLGRAAPGLVPPLL